MTKRKVFQESLVVSENHRKGKKKGEQRGSKGSKRCFKCGEAGHFKWECPLWKKCKGGENSDSISSIAESEDSNEILIVSKEIVGCGISEMTSDGTTECTRFEGTATMFKLQQRAQ